MEEALARLVFDYHKQHRLIDNAFIVKALDIIVEAEKLQEFIEDYRIDRQGRNIAAYRENLKIVELNPDRVELYAQEEHRKYPNLSPRFVYLQFLKVLLHEGNHAKQKKQQRNHSDIESILLSAEDYEANRIKKMLDQVTQTGSEETLSLFTMSQDFFKLWKARSLYKKYYSFALSERLAEMEAAKTSAHIAKCLEEPGVENAMLETYWLRQLRGYQTPLNPRGVESPTMFYLEKIKQKDYVLKRIKQATQPLKEFDKLRLGLKVKEGTLCVAIENVLTYGFNAHCALGDPFTVEKKEQAQLQKLFVLQKVFDHYVKDENDS